MANINKIVQTTAGAASAGTIGASVAGKIAIGTGTGALVGGSGTVVAIAVGEGSAATGTMAIAAGAGSVANGTLFGIAAGAVSTAALPAIGTVVVVGSLGLVIGWGVKKLYFNDKKK